jgi:hypothetical protein
VKEFFEFTFWLYALLLRAIDRTVLSCLASAASG